jgi:hypothetical protein
MRISKPGDKRRELVDEALQLGQSLLDPVNGLGLWARQNRAAIQYARQRFDAAENHGLK